MSIFKGMMLALSLLGATTVASAALTVGIGSGSGTGAISVPLTLLRPAGDANEVYSLTVRYTFNSPPLSATFSNVGANLPANAAVSCGTLGATLLCALTTNPATAIAVGNYQLGQVTFGVAPGTAGPQTVNTTIIECTDSIGNALDQACGAASGTITVSSGGASTVSYTGHWHRPSESGWGLTIAQQGDVLFPNWFTFDSDGKPLWFGMLAGARSNGVGGYSGLIYRTRGTPFNLINGQQAFDTVNTVGQGTLTFSATNRLRFDYSIGSVSQTKQLEPLIFGQATTCSLAPGVNLDAATNYTDVWNNPNESGWGVHLTQQGSVIFGIWYTYDSAGRDQWLSAVANATGSNQNFTGDLRQITGTAFSNINDTQAFTSAPVVGSVRFNFTNGTTATMTYTVGAITQTKALRRYIFGTQPTVCR